MHDYERIAEVIRYLDEHHTEQPNLATLAARVGLSPSHFHRLFSAWASVTPKDFLQCLTLTHVKGLLRDGASVLDCALDAGLSGPGRLHDLCVTLQAASPGEMKSRGAGWTLNAGFTSTPFGIALLAESPRGITHLGFVESGGAHAAWTELQREWPKARWHRDDAAAARMGGRIFRRTTRPVSHRPLHVLVRGSSFQVRVWQALLRVPAGRLVTYGSLATAVGHPGAARAVGSAMARNPLAYLIPCHRVIRETGAVGDYRWGGVRKRAILAWESARQMRLKEDAPGVNRETERNPGRCSQSRSKEAGEPEASTVSQPAPGAWRRFAGVARQAD